LCFLSRECIPPSTFPHETTPHHQHGARRAKDVSNSASPFVRKAREPFFLGSKAAPQCIHTVQLASGGAAAAGPPPRLRLLAHAPCAQAPPHMTDSKTPRSAADADGDVGAEATAAPALRAGAPRAVYAVMMVKDGEHAGENFTKQIGVFASLESSFAEAAAAELSRLEPGRPVRAPYTKERWTCVMPIGCSRHAPRACAASR